MDNIKETVIYVLDKLHQLQDTYIDPSEYIYDAEKMIKRHLDNKDLIKYVPDLIWALESSIENDFSNTIKECLELLKTDYEKFK